jgi:hypothetical protein
MFFIADGEGNIREQWFDTKLNFQVVDGNHLSG